MLADSFLPNTFWAEAVSTTCYVLNRVFVTKPQNKRPYELITGKIPIISYIRPFGCHVTILNTIDHLGKFEKKSDEGFLVGYSLNSKAFRVYNLETKRVEENLHINFLENKPNVAGKGPNWLFDLDYLTDSMNYQPVTAENKANKTAGPKEANHSTGTQDNIDARNSEIEAEPAQEYFVLPLWSSYTSTVKSSEAKNGDEKPNGDTGPKTNEEPKDQEDQAFLEELERLKRQEKEASDAAEAFRKEFAQCTKDLLLQAGAARATSTNTVDTVSTPISTASPSEFLSMVFFYSSDFLSRNHCESIFKSLEDESWVDAMQEELLQFKIPKVWILVDLPFRKKAIRTKWVYRNKKDERGVVVRNKEKYAAEILMKFDFDSVKTVSTPIETQKPLVKDEEATDVDVTPKTSHLHAVKRIFSDYAEANLDRKSTTEGCQFLGRRLISWQWKKQTIVATSTTDGKVCIVLANSMLWAITALVLWGHLRTIFDANTKDELWQNQERWNLKSWHFYENYGVHTLTLEDGTEIHMLAERKYPLTKETLERMMSLKLIAESASDGAYDLLRFIQKQIDEARSHDGGEKDL
ncbi:retrovirus-related pol polyprotein from transposon TNT 1-94 [Tanacetum coccineum]